MLLAVDAPPLSAVDPSLRQLVGEGVLIQRELISGTKFASEIGRRASRVISIGQLEQWDEQGVLSPLAFAIGTEPWMSWRTTDPYPVDDIDFRDERDFVAWQELEARSADDLEQPRARPLYSEWQLLYFSPALGSTSVAFPLDLLSDRRRRRKWIKGLRSWATQHEAAARAVHAAWLPTIKLLLRLQARHWPHVRESSTLLIDPTTRDYVDALDLEFDGIQGSQVQTELGVSTEQLDRLYEWLATKARFSDPLPDEYELLRLQRRRLAERRQGDALRSLDYVDAAQVVRRFIRELSGHLPPDIDQIGISDDEPRPLRRDRRQLRDALRRRGLDPNRLHLIVEGETEVRVIKRLFEAFSARSWEGAGLEITSLGGDKLEGSRPMIEGFAAYAQDIALLLDNENDVQRITKQITDAGLIPPKHVTLSEPSFEEANFSAAELIELVAAIARDKGGELTLSEEELLAAIENENQGRSNRLGMARVLQRQARAPEHGAVVFSKLELADAMTEHILSEIVAAEGDHQAVAARRPIVGWVLAYPLRAFRGA